MTDAKIWYLNSNGQTYGPYTGDEVISMLKDKTVQFSDYVFKEGFQGWEYIYNVSDFDRRILFPGGDQPLVQLPKESVPAEQSPVKEESIKDGEDLWFVHYGENQLGPYSSSYIKEGLNNKTIFWTYYVWRDGFENWVQIKNCKEFDRRTKARGESPIGLGITTDYEQIREQAVNAIPKTDYGDISHPSNFQYGVSELEQEELKGKYPVKAIIALILIAASLFGIVKFYPLLVIRAREKKAMKMYEQGVTFVEDKKYEQGFNLLADLSDMYPNTKAARKDENYLRSKEPMIKAQKADEGRKIRKSIEEYVKTYGMLPINAVDISYAPSFWMKYFGEVYYKKDTLGKVAIMVKGTRMPVEGYVFTIDGNNGEQENDLTPAEFESKAQSFIKLVYTGARTNIKPLVVPQMAKRDTIVIEIDSKGEPIKKEKVKEVKKEVKKEIKEVVEPLPEEEPAVVEDNSQDDALIIDENVSPKKKTSKFLRTPQEEAAANAGGDNGPAANKDEFKDEINKIKER